MRQTELKILRLHAPLRYAPAPISGGRPFPPRERPSEGAEDAALYEPDSIVRFDPRDGPRALPSLPEPAAAGWAPASSAPHGTVRDTFGPGALCLEPGAYGFLQGAAASEGEWLGLIEAFARQAWWEGTECEGPYIVRRVREDGRWAAQVWRRLAGESRDPAGGG